MKYEFNEPVRMQVIHPTYGKVEVLAYNPYDARMQAANHWDFDDFENMKVAIEKKALERLKQEQPEQITMEEMK